MKNKKELEDAIKKGVKRALPIIKEKLQKLSGTRVFFVVDSVEDNEEIFETLEQAEAYFLSGLSETEGRRIRVCLVRNAYKEDGVWNYDDYSDTFTDIKTIQ